MSSEKLKTGIAALTAVTLGAPAPARADDEAALCSWRHLGDTADQKCTVSEDGREATCEVAEGKTAKLGIRHGLEWTVREGTPVPEYNFTRFLRPNTSLSKDQVALEPGNHSVFCRRPGASGTATPSAPGAGSENPDFIELRAEVMETDQDIRAGVNVAERPIPDKVDPELRVGLGIGGASVGHGAKPAGLLEGSIETIHRRGTTGARSLFSGGLDATALFGQVPFQTEKFEDAEGRVLREVTRDTRFAILAGGLFARIAGDSDFGLQLSLQAGWNAVAEKDTGRFAVLGKGELEIPLFASASPGASRIRDKTRLNLGLQVLGGTVGDHGFYHVGGGVVLRR